MLCLQGEQLAAGGLAPDGSHVVLASSGGLLAHFPLDTVRQAGRAAGCIKVRVCGGGLLLFETCRLWSVRSGVAVGRFQAPVQPCSLCLL
jgi:hypothetical protein